MMWSSAYCFEVTVHRIITELPVSIYVLHLTNCYGRMMPRLAEFLFPNKVGFKGCSLHGPVNVMYTAYKHRHEEKSFQIKMRQAKAQIIMDIRGV